MFRPNVISGLFGITLSLFVVSAVSANPVDAQGPKPPRPHPIDGSQDPRPDRPPRDLPDDPDQGPVSRPKKPSKTQPEIKAPAPVRAPVDRDEVRRGARQFRTFVDQGRVRLLNGDRDRAQIESLSLDGLFQWPGTTPVQTKPETDVAPEGPPDLLPPEGSPKETERPVKSSRAPHANPYGLGSGDRDSPAAFTSVVAALPAKSSAPRLATEPPPEFFQMLNALGASSSEEKPFSITSLLRPPYKTARYTMQSPTNPHALGIAVDIAAFGGHTILTTDPEEETQALLALLRSLPPGRYRMGLPKAPETKSPANVSTPAPEGMDADPVPTGGEGDVRGRSAPPLPSRGLRRQDPDRRSARGDRAAAESEFNQTDTAAVTPGAWPFFPAPRKEVDARGRSVWLFANERYAPESELNDPRIRRALAEARRRGVDVFALFPDGVNHIHVDVKQIL